MKRPTAPLGEGGIWVKVQESKRKLISLALGSPGPRSSIHVRDLEGTMLILISLCMYPFVQNWTFTEKNTTNVKFLTFRNCVGILP